MLVCLSSPRIPGAWLWSHRGARGHRGTRLRCRWILNDQLLNSPCKSAIRTYATSGPLRKQGLNLENARPWRIDRAGGGRLMTLLLILCFSLLVRGQGVSRAPPDVAPRSSIRRSLLSIGRGGDGGPLFWHQPGVCKPGAGFFHASQGLSAPKLPSGSPRPSSLPTVRALFPFRLATEPAPPSAGESSGITREPPSLLPQPELSSGASYPTSPETLRRRGGASPDDFSS